MFLSHSCSGKNSLAALIPLFFAVVGFHSSVFPQAIPRAPYSFDAGGRGSALDRFSILLTECDRYTAEKGYGWTAPVAVSFVRGNLFAGTMRDEFTCDGVSGRELGFRIDLPAGVWWFTFWMEMGYEFRPTTELWVQGRRQQVRWHELKPDEEGEVHLSPLYRVVHGLYPVDSGSFSFELRGVQDSVRLLGFTLIPAVSDAAPPDEELMRLIREAGRYRSSVSTADLARHLERRLAGAPADPWLFYWRQQVAFLAEAERFRDMMGWEWASEITGLSIFDRLHQALFLLDANIEYASGEGRTGAGVRSGPEPGVREDPLAHMPVVQAAPVLLAERARWVRGKMSYDLVKERGGNYQAGVASEDLAWLRRRFPSDRTLAMFTGVRIDIPDASDHLPVRGNPPRWALLEREAISRLRREVDWWVQVRQASNGELGGKIDDDVEILREWIPLLLFGDTTTIRGWTRLADAVWKSPRVDRGFSRRVRDVEHSAEFISDSTPELLVVDSDSVYLRRLLFTADHFEHLWSTTNRFGRRFFKSAWLGATGIDERPPRNRDLEMNSRALKPLRYLAWGTRNPRFIGLVDAWARAWLSAALRTDKGKPEGIIPASVRWYDEAINGDEPNWYDANMLWDYFAWEDRCGSLILDHLLFAYGLSGNDSLLIPIECSLRLVSDQLRLGTDLRAGRFEPGSVPWTAQGLLRNTSFWSTVQKWRVMSHKSEFDTLISAYGTPYLKYQLTGDEHALEEGLEPLLDVLRYNSPLRTDLVLHTDRVRIPGVTHLKALISGDATQEGNSPYFAVSWSGTGENLAVLVKRSTKNRLATDAYNFGDSATVVEMRPWQLEPGVYSLSVVAEGRSCTRPVRIAGPGVRIPVEIPSGVRTGITLTRSDP